MKILHVFRTPVGGLFRHVRDLVRGQHQLGHEVGIVCDSITGGNAADQMLSETLPFCKLGIERIAISRLPGLGDLAAAKSTRLIAERLRADIIHGHGAKGGLYGRLAAGPLGIPSVYTPHGGSLHYTWRSFPGALFLGVEWKLARMGSGMVFVCEYERKVFAKKIGLSGKPCEIIYNGLWLEEFRKVNPIDGAADILFMGDMRQLKGVDLLLNAIALLRRKRNITANLVGDGPDLEKFQALAKSLGLADSVHFPGRLPTADALTRGRLLVMPSRAESFPYVVLEAAAGEVPMIASDVGGIPEILPPENLCPPENIEALARHIEMALTVPDAIAKDAKQLSALVATKFSAEKMALRVVDFYQRLLHASRKLPRL